jgi:HSP20 family protein
MMTLVRWHRAPDARTLQHEMSRLMQAFSQGGMQDRRTWQQRTWAPAIDLSEDADAFTLTAELPGFSKDDVQVEVKDNQLTLKGERKREADVQEKHYRRVERVYGRFERSIKLPAVIDAEKAQATFKDGVLKLTLPKVAEAKPKAISITA